MITISEHRKITDLEELDKLLSLVRHLDTKYSKYWISNVSLEEEAIKYIKRVKSKLPKIYEEIENGSTDK